MFLLPNLNLKPSTVTHWLNIVSSLNSKTRSCVKPGQVIYLLWCLNGIYKSRRRGREDVSINTGNIEALALSGDNTPLPII
jgi:hypothetical protein